MVGCRVKGCRFAYTHATRGHRCGRCYAYGHGVRECGDVAARAALRSYWDEGADAPCTVPGCPAPRTHTAEAHYCARCAVRGPACHCAPPRTVSSVVLLQRTCPLCKVESDVDASAPIFTGADCVVCLDPGPCVLFPSCNHAVVCGTCAERL